MLGCRIGMWPQVWQTVNGQISSLICIYGTCNEWKHSCVIICMELLLLPNSLWRFNSPHPPCATPSILTAMVPAGTSKGRKEQAPSGASSPKAQPPPAAVPWLTWRGSRWGACSARPPRWGCGASAACRSRGASPLLQPWNASPSWAHRASGDSTAQQKGTSTSLQPNGGSSHSNSWAIPSLHGFIYNKLLRWRFSLISPYRKADSGW